jgi:hypothetical protein
MRNPLSARNPRVSSLVIRNPVNKSFKVYGTRPVTAQRERVMPRPALDYNCTTLARSAPRSAHYMILHDSIFKVSLLSMSPLSGNLLSFLFQNSKTRITSRSRSRKPLVPSRFPLLSIVSSGVHQDATRHSELMQQFFIIE